MFKIYFSRSFSDVLCIVFFAGCDFQVRQLWSNSHYYQHRNNNNNNNNNQISGVNNTVDCLMHDVAMYLKTVNPYTQLTLQVTPNNPDNPNNPIL